MDFLIHPCRWIDDEENVRTPPKLGRYWEIHPLRPWDFPRPSRFPLGFALGKSLGSREISWALGMDFPIPPSFWWSTDTLPTKDPFYQNVFSVSWCLPLIATTVFQAAIITLGAKSQKVQARESNILSFLICPNFNPRCACRTSS